MLFLSRGGGGGGGGKCGFVGKGQTNKILFSA